MKSPQKTFLILLLSAATLTGCLFLKEPRKSIVLSGFLENYAQLNHRPGAKAYLVYLNRSVEFSRYTKIKFDEVEVWSAGEAGLNKADQKDLQWLAGEFTRIIRQQLSEEYVFSEEPGADVMILRVALTDAKRASRIGWGEHDPNIKGMSLEGFSAISHGSLPAVGEASVEMEMVDSRTKLRLLAAVDHKVGSGQSRTSPSHWADVKTAFEQWAKDLDDSLDQLRAGNFPPEN